MTENTTKAPATRRGFSALGGEGFPESPVEWVPAKDLFGKVHTVVAVLKSTDTYKGVTHDEALVLFRTPGAPAPRAYSTTWQVVVKKLFTAKDEGMLPLDGVLITREKPDGNSYYDIVDPEDAPRLESMPF